MDKSPLGTRRDLLKGLFATGLALKLGGCGGNDSSTVKPTSIMTSEEAFTELDNGNARFVARTPSVRDTAELDRIWTQNAMTQLPFAAILTCADSRLAPEIIFDQFLGDIFVVREAGNIATSATNLGSLEYSQAVLGVKALLVLGHSSCGAVDAAFKNQHPGGNIDAIVDAISPNIAGASTLDDAIARNVKATIAQIRSMSAIIKSAEDAGKLQLRGAVYNLATGIVTYTDA
jgi:carbonic anhydrase